MYDVDPTLGSTSVPYFNELAGIYRFYRLVRSNIKVSYSNNEAFGVNVYVLPMNFDPTANSTNYEEFVSNPLCKQRMIGPLTGNGVTLLTHNATTAQFAGSMNPHVADYYSGPTSGASAPVNSWYWTYGFTTGGSVIVNGITTNVQVFMDAEFYELGTPAV
jgi:hypothetical protein